MKTLDRPSPEHYRSAVVLAHKEVSALCHGKKFEMSIPVQASDPDIVIGNGLYVADQLLDEIDALRAKLAEYEAAGDRLAERVEIDWHGPEMVQAWRKARGKT